ncbi:MAG TPA: slipin family protein, partial [Candidatus Eisenbacteria bacterium]|nr:slipin family protein [Candidatus Eisenbacteria bacterium]
MGISLGVIILLGIMLVSSSVRVLREYERAVVFRLGRFSGVKGPGLFFLIPILDRMVRVPLRIITMDVPPQDVITKDNVTIKVNAVLYFRVVNPEGAILTVENFLYATSQIAQTTLRSVTGEHELDQILSERETINQTLQKIIDERTDPWGVKVTAVEMKDVDLPPEMKRAIARQAEAERERRAKVIHAEGELQASEKLAAAAHVIGAEPTAIQLRYLSTLAEISTEHTNTIVFPIPLTLLEGLSAW